MLNIYKMYPFDSVQNGFLMCESQDDVDSSLWWPWMSDGKTSTVEDSQAWSNFKCVFCILFNLISCEYDHFLAMCGSGAGEERALPFITNFSIQVGWWNVWSLGNPSKQKGWRKDVCQVEVGQSSGFVKDEVGMVMEWHFFIFWLGCQQ